MTTQENFKFHAVFEHYSNVTILVAIFLSEGDAERFCEEMVGKDGVVRQTNSISWEQWTKVKEGRQPDVLEDYND